MQYSYEITPRPTELGGGWRLRLLEDGEEVGGRVFPVAPADPRQGMAWWNAMAEAERLGGFGMAVGHGWGSLYPAAASSRVNPLPQGMRGSLWERVHPRRGRACQPQFQSVPPGRNARA